MVAPNSIIYELTISCINIDMSDTFFCLDCERSITFLHVGHIDYMRMIPDRKHLGALSRNTIILVRCEECMETKGSLESGMSTYTDLTGFAQRESYKALLENIVAFMKAKGYVIVLTYDDPFEIGGNPVYENVDKMIEPYMSGMACMSFVGNSFGPAHKNFCTIRETDTQTNTVMWIDDSGDESEHIDINATRIVDEDFSSTVVSSELMHEILSQRPTTGSN